MSLLAIFLAVVVAVALGMMWFSPLMFGREWMILQGMNPDKVDRSRAKKIWKSYLSNTLLTIVTAFVSYAILASGFGMVSLFAIWSAFSLPVYANSIWWGKKPLKLFMIETGYSIVALTFMAQVIIWTAGIR